MKNIFAVLAAIIIVASIGIYFNYYKSITNEDTTATTTKLLNAVTITHPNYISVYEPRSPLASDKSSRGDTRMTSMLPYMQSIDTASTELLNDESFKGYFVKSMDATNTHNTHVVVLSPKTVLSDNLNFFILFASRKDVLPDLTLKFEIICMDKVVTVRWGSTSIQYLGCEQAKSAANEIASSIDIFEADVLKSEIQKLVDEQKRKVDALIQKSRDSQMR